MTCPRSYKKVGPSSSSSVQCLPPHSPLPSCCHFLPIAVQIHLGITPEGQDQAQGATVGTGRGQESHCPSAPTSQPWPNPSLPSPTCCQGSPPQEGWSPPHSDPLLWILPAGSEVLGVGLPPAELPGKMEEALNYRGSWICSFTSSWTYLAPCQPLYHQFPEFSGYLKIQ